MPITGDFTAYDYRLPDDQPKQNLNELNGQGASQGASGFNMQAPPSDLEEVEGRTGNFYKKYSDLYGFANAMKKTYNIDVTAPDITNPESVQAHQIFLKMYADVKHEGDQLHQAKKRADYMAQGLAEGKLLGDQGYIANQQGKRMTSNQELMSGVGANKVSDLVEGANKVMKHYYDQGAYDMAEQHRKEVLQYLTNEMQSAVENGQFGKAKEFEMNINALRDPSVSEDPNLALRKKMLDEQARHHRAMEARALAKKKGEETPESILVRDIGNIMDGNPDSFRQSHLVSPDGNAYLEAPYSGISLAGKDAKGKLISRPVDKFLLDPKTGKMVVMFQDGKVQPVDRSTGDAFQLLQNISSNTGYGKTFKMDEIQNYAKDQGLTLKSGGIKYQTNKNPESEKSMVANEAIRSGAFRDMYKVIDNNLSSLSRVPAFREPIVISSNGNPTLKIYKGLGGSFFIEDADGNKVADGLGSKGVRDYLTKEGIIGGIVDGEYDIHSSNGAHLNPEVKHKIQSEYNHNGGVAPLVNATTEQSETTPNNNEDLPDFSNF